MRALAPLRHQGRLIGPARHHGEVLGTIELIDPLGTAGEAGAFALRQACTALGLEPAHRRSLAEAALRMSREPVNDLLTGADDRFVGAVGRAAQGLGLRSLLARRSEMAVLVVQGEPRDSGLYDAVADELGSLHGVVGSAAGARPRPTSPTPSNRPSAP